MVANPRCGLHLLDLRFSGHGRGAGWMRLGPDQRPWAVLGCVFRFGTGRVVVLGDAAAKVVGRPDIETTLWVLQNLCPISFSSSRQTPRAGLQPQADRLPSNLAVNPDAASGLALPIRCSSSHSRPMPDLSHFSRFMASDLVGCSSEKTKTHGPVWRLVYLPGLVAGSLCSARRRSRSLV